MIRHDLSPAEVRVLGCLIEKQRTTPDQYPLSRNSVRLAANQSTNRDPVVDYDEDTVRAALERLGRYGLVRFTSARGSRTAKYRQLAGEQLGVADGELSLLGLLMLRGPQTPGELRGRSERLHRFDALDGVEEALGRLIEAGLVVRFERRPGQKEQRFGHLLSSALEGDDEAAAAVTPPDGSAPALDKAAPTPPLDPTAPKPAPGTRAPAPASAVSSPAAADPYARAPALEARVATLEADLAALRRQLADLLDEE